MPLAIQCPGCAARLTVADAAAGTVAKCPKCGTAMTVPATAPPPSRPSLRLKTPPPQPSPIEDDEPPRPARRRRVEDEDDRPARRRARDEEDDDEDDRPVRRKRKAKPSGPPVWVFVAAGVGALVLLAAVGVATYLLTDRTTTPGDGKPTIVRPGEGGGLLGTAAPAGWSEVRDAEGGYRVYMPGTASKINFSHVAAANAAQGTTGLSGYTCVVPLSDPRTGPPLTVQIRVISLTPSPDKIPGTSAEQLYEAVKGRHPVMETFEDVLEKRPVTLGGKPGLLVVTKKKARRTGVADDPNVPDWARQQERDHEAKEAAARKLHYVTTDGKRVVFVEVEAPADPDPAMLKTLTESFQFV